MRIMTRLTVVVGALLLCSGIFAQSAKLNRADRLFNLMSYAEAIVVYKEVLATDSGNAHAVSQIAECYRKVNDPLNAEPWFAKAVALPGSQPLQVLYYAQVLMMNGKYDQALVQFRRFSELEPGDSRGPAGVAACTERSALLAGNDNYQVINQAFNTAAAEFSPARFQDGLVFTSDRATGKREGVFEWTGRPYVNLWFASNTGGNSWSDPAALTGGINTKYNDGPGSFTSDGSQIFFTRNYVSGRKKVEKSGQNVVGLKIMRAGNGGDVLEWSVATDIGLNSTEFSTGHPAISADGKMLFFTSDRPGGRGGADIWMSRFDGSRWLDPVNLGSGINTEGIEGFPFFSEDSVLYFASNARAGLGGLDVFYSKMKRDGSFGPATNAGAPLNSSADDFALIANRGLMEGYFSSNRKGGRGDDDIYYFVSLLTELEVYVYDCDSEEPLASAGVSVTTSKGRVFNGTTDAQGIVSTTIHRNLEYVSRAIAEGYPADSVTFSTASTRPGEAVRVTICLSRKCLVQGVVKDIATGELIGGATVSIAAPAGGYASEVVTGTDGQYSFKVSVGTYTLSARKEGYVYDERQVAVSLTEQPCIVHQDLLLRKFDHIVFDNIYYDFDKANIREDASVGLMQLLRILQENPQARVELASHTDSRGPDPYNQGLSERRAKSAVEWLVAHGIERGRLEVRGHGEAQLRNHCGNGVPCTEYEHQRNRRTEVTVIKPDGERLVGLERYSDADKRFEYVSGGWYKHLPRVDGTLLPGGTVPPGVTPDPPAPKPEPGTEPVKPKPEPEPEPIPVPEPRPIP